MKIINSIRQKWGNFLKTISSKLSIYTLIGFILIIGLSYALQWVFTWSSLHQRAIVGTILQLIAGFILISDQVVANIQPQRIKSKWKELTKKKMRISLLVCLGIFLVIVIIWMIVSEETPSLWATVIGILIWLGIVYYIHLKSILWMIDYLEKHFPKRKDAGVESNVKWANMVLFFASLPLTVLTGFFVRIEETQLLILKIASILWSLFFAFTILPIFVLSILFFLILFFINTFTFIRKKVNRIVFWLTLLILWLFGSLLLLMNVLNT